MFAFFRLKQKNVLYFAISLFLHTSCFTWFDGCIICTSARMLFHSPFLRAMLYFSVHLVLFHRTIWSKWIIMKSIRSANEEKKKRKFHFNQLFKQDLFQIVHSSQTNIARSFMKCERLNGIDFHWKRLVEWMHETKQKMFVKPKYVYPKEWREYQTDECEEKKNDWTKHG